VGKRVRTHGCVILADGGIGMVIRADKTGQGYTSGIECDLPPGQLMQLAHDYAVLAPDRCAGWKDKLMVNGVTKPKLSRTFSVFLFPPGRKQDQRHTGEAGVFSWPTISMGLGLSG